MKYIRPMPKMSNGKTCLITLSEYFVRFCILGMLNNKALEQT